MILIHRTNKAGEKTWKSRLSAWKGKQTMFKKEEIDRGWHKQHVSKYIQTCIYPLNVPTLSNVLVVKDRKQKAEDMQLVAKLDANNMSVLQRQVTANKKHLKAQCIRTPDQIKVIVRRCACDKTFDKTRTSDSMCSMGFTQFGKAKLGLHK